MSLLAAGCGGGGGGSSNSGSVSGKILHVVAPVVSDSCGERVDTVNQQFVIGDNVIDTSIVKMTAESQGGNVLGTFQEVNGECVRDYTIQIDGYNSDAPHVVLTSQSACGLTTCQTVWEGTANEDTTLRDVSSDVEFRINGERCNANVPTDVKYRPSSFECNGNAAVLLGGNQRDNYSVVVRRDGQYNDRDPENPSCGTNRCSPYKTQKKMELAEYQVNCLGGSGFSAKYDGVKRISIKYVALVTNPGDTRQFEQYCINNVEANLN